MSTPAFLIDGGKRFISKILKLKKHIMSRGLLASKDKFHFISAQVI